MTNLEPIKPAFDRIGGPECPVCLGLGFRCHPDGGLIACVEVCDRCEAALNRRAKVLMESYPDLLDLIQNSHQALDTPPEKEV